MNEFYIIKINDGFIRYLINYLSNKFLVEIILKRKN